jgi:uncharacterized membrane protein
MPPSPAPDPLDARATPPRLRALAEAGVLPPAALPRALGAALGSPPPAAWAAFLDAALLALGLLLVLAGVVFFFAFNWDALGRFARFAVLEAAIVATALGAWRLWPRPAGQALLTASAVLVGPLLAVYGQAYPTGADAWELFAGWAALVLPWVLLARSQPLWVLWLGLGNVALPAYWEQVRGGAVEAGRWALPLLALVDGAAWLLVEAASRRGVAWLQGRWMPRLLLVASALWLLPLGMDLALELGDWRPLVAERLTAPALASLAGLVLLGVALTAAFRGPRLELFHLAVGAALLVTVATCLLAGLLVGRREGGAGGLLALAVLLLAELTAAAAWLRAQARRRPLEDP